MTEILRVAYAPPGGVDETRSLARAAACFLLSAIVAPGLAQAWSAGYSVGPKTYKESAALTHTWNAVSECTTFTFHHYAACYFEGDVTPPSAPSSPSGGTCFTLSTNRTTTSADQFVHRSDRYYYSRIFACQNTSCSQYYGDGTAGCGAVSGDADTAHTDKERWVLVGVEDYEDEEYRVVDDPAVTASAAIFYPSGWTYAGYLGLWYSTQEDGADVIYYKRATSSGWQNFNNTSWTTPVLVAQEVPEGDFLDATHPWVIPVHEGSARYIRMFVHTGYGMDGIFTMYSIDSYGSEGSDFDLTCGNPFGCSVGGGTCGHGDECDWSSAWEEICDDGIAACDYMESAGHGRILWDYIAYGGVDFGSDAFSMIFTGDIADSCEDGEDPDDIFQADWLPEATPPQWSVPDVDVDECPDMVEDGGHDPAMTPLPEDSFKAYWASPVMGSQVHRVCYTDDVVSWGDCSEIDFAFDDSTRLGTLDSSLLDCVGNMDTLVFVGTSGPKEGAFLQAGTKEGCFASHSILFAELRN